MRAFLLAAVAIAAPVAAKQKSAPLEQVRTCLYDPLDEATRKAIAASLIADLDRPAPEPAVADKGAAHAVDDDPATDELAKRAAECAHKHKWPDRQIEPAVGWTMMTLAEPTMRGRAAAAGLDFGMVERTATALSTSDRALLINGAGDQADAIGERLLTAASNAGILILARNDDERAQMLGVLVGFIIVRDKYLAELATR